MARGDGRIYMHGSFFWCCYYLRGTQHRETTGTADETQARKFLKARLREVGADVIGARAFVTPKANRILISELAAALRTRYELEGKASTQNLGVIKRIEKDFGDYRATALTSEKIDAYIKARRDAGAAKATVNRVTGMLLQCFNLGVKNKHFPATAVPSITHLSEKGNERIDFMEPADYARVLSFLPDDGLRDFCEWSYATGQRKNEIASLRWGMLDSNGCTLNIPANVCKNRKARALPLSPELAQIIERRKPARRVTVNGVATMTEFIFHRNGQPIREFRKSWGTACTKAGVSGVFHSCRRSCARNLSQAGVPRHIAKKVTGHVSDSMWDRYNIGTDADVLQAMQQTEAYRATARAAAQKVLSIARG